METGSGTKNKKTASFKNLLKKEKKRLNRFYKLIFDEADINDKKHHYVILDLLSKEEVRLLLRMATTDQSNGVHVSLLDRIRHYFPHIPDKTVKLILFFFQKNNFVNTKVSWVSCFFRQKQLINAFIEKIKSNNLVKNTILDNLKQSNLVKYGPNFKYLAPCDWAKSGATCLTAIILCGSFASFLANLFTGSASIIGGYFVTHTSLATFVSALSGLGLPMIAYLLYWALHFVIFKWRHRVETTLQVECLEKLEAIPNYKKIIEYKPPSLKTDHAKLAGNYDMSAITTDNDNALNNKVKPMSTQTC